MSLRLKSEKPKEAWLKTLGQKYLEDSHLSARLEKKKKKKKKKKKRRDKLLEDGLNRKNQREDEMEKELEDHMAPWDTQKRRTSTLSTTIWQLTRSIATKAHNLEND